MNAKASQKIAVLVPCYNEELTVAKVVKDFKAALPDADVYVFDNNSKDKTSERAREAGAIVIPSPKQGKGNVVRHMFHDVEADVYIMVDGDDTYPASEAQKLLKMFQEKKVDMLVGARLVNFDKNAFRAMHFFGNRLVAELISFCFSVRLTDILSGYRIFSRDYVKHVPLMSNGFDIETEMTLQAIDKGFKICETTIPYGSRPEGSFSKLNTYTDGYLVLKAIFTVLKDYRPLTFYTALTAVLGVLSLLAGSLPILDFINYHYVYRVPLAILAVAFGLAALITMSIGIILDTIHKYHLERYELWRMSYRKSDK